MDNKSSKQNLESSGGGVSKKRRTLVKGGVAAVPAVLTLRSGAAFAAASATQCAVNDQIRAQQQQPDPLPSKGNFDNFANDPWVRQRVACRFIRNKDPANQTDEFWIFQNPLDGTQWFNEAENTNGGVVYSDDGLSMMVGGGQNYDVITNDSTIQADVIGIFDRDSKQIFAFGADPVERRNITHSCYVSIMNA